jgi:hypothetical protein
MSSADPNQLRGLGFGGEDVQVLVYQPLKKVRFQAPDIAMV